MLVTSKEANKLLQQFEQEHRALITKEHEIKSFLAAVGEDVESCRPEYDYEAVQKTLSALEETTSSQTSNAPYLCASLSHP